MNFLSQFEPYLFPLLGLVRLPQIEINPQDKIAIGLKANSSNIIYLKRLCWNGYLQKRHEKSFVGITEQQVIDRLKMEFEVFEKTGTHDYFLFLWDLNKWCDEQGIIRGCGRGSSGGSFSMFCLNIVTINALQYNLSFSRFLSEARTKPKVIDGILYIDGKTAPDVDGDYEYLRRPEILKYIEDKYPGKTCKISTRLQLTGKTALKDVLKAYLEYDETSSKQITDFITSHFGQVENLDEAILSSTELKSWIEEKPENKRAFDIARSIEGLNIAKGQHPSGVFISYYPLDGNVPIELSKTKDIVTQYDMQVAATLAIKADILGIRTLNILGEACKHAKINIKDIDVNHPSIYSYFQNTNLFGQLFQIEEGLSKQMVSKIKPRDMDCLACLMALPRPGSLKHYDQFNDFINKGIIKPVYTPLDDILKTTGGIILFQENITEVCIKLFGMTEINADQVRYYVGKKLKDEMKKIEPILYENGRARGVPEDIIKYFWDTCNASADYLFVKSHAYEYANLTAQTTYMKANYPKEFTLASLKMSKFEPNSQTVLTSIISEAKQLGVKILPPDIIKSQEDFSVEPEGVRFGLSHIRGISDANMAKLLSFRRDLGSKFDIFSAAQDSKISISVLVGLIMSGSIDPKGISRAKLALEAQLYNILTPRETLIVRQLAPQYSDDLIALIKDLAQKTDEKGKPYIKESRLTTMRRDFKPFEQMYKENSRNEELFSLLSERHFLGFSYTSTLHNVFSKKIEGLMTIDNVLQEPQNIKVRFVGFIDEVKKATSLKSRKPYVKFTISDETGAIKVMLHGDENISSCVQFHGELPDIGDIIVVSASKGSGDLVFCGPASRRDESFVRQASPFASKKSDLKVEI